MYCTSMHHYKYMWGGGEGGGIDEVTGRVLVADRLCGGCGCTSYWLVLS